MSHSHSHVAHVLLSLAVVPSSISFYEGMLVASFPISEERGGPTRKGSLDVFTSFFLPSFLPSSRLVSNSLNFLLLLSVPFDARENFRNFARPFRAKNTRAKKRSSVYTSRSGREREIKDGDLASFRASLLFGPVLFVDRRFCINRNLSPPKTKPPVKRGIVDRSSLCCSRRALS